MIKKSIFVFIQLYRFNVNFEAGISNYNKYFQFLVSLLFFFSLINKNINTNRDIKFVPTETNNEKTKCNGKNSSYSEQLDNNIEIVFIDIQVQNIVVFYIIIQALGDFYYNQYSTYCKQFQFTI